MGQRGNSRGNFRRGRGHHSRGNHRGGRSHGRGGRGGRGGFKPRFAKDSSLPRPEQLTEVEVGITEYISALDGFTAVIKARYSDFHVNEIDLDDNVAKLTDTNMPEEFKVIRAEVPTESPLKEVSEEQWQEIKALVESTDDTKSVHIDVTSNDKESRSTIHKTLKSIFHSKIISNTVEEGDKKTILLKRLTGKNKHDRSEEWPAQVPIYTHFLLYKECQDTMNAIMNISEALRMNSTAFNYAGVKDRRAKTTQWISCKKVEPSKLLYRTKRCRNIKIGNIKFKDAPLKLGQLNGNLFRLALRDVKVDDDVINTHLEHLKKHGFINYYGLQRFGNDKSTPTHLIGIKLMQGSFREACNLILKPKQHEDPLSDLTQAKKVYEETQNAKEAVKKLTSNQTIESKLINGLAKCGKNDFVTALECIPRNMRLMYIHAFQSLVWNQAVSKRVKDFGLKPVVGDLVCLSEEGDTEIVEDAKVIKAREEIIDTKCEEEVKAKEESDEEDPENRDKRLVKVLTEEDLPNYTIYDVVLPLPGYDVTYPENLKSYYKELLGEHKLELEMPQQRVKCYTLSGNYRRIIRKATDLAWHTIQYNDPHDTLIRSDFEEILKHNEPKSNPDGQYKGLVVSFKLRSSSYATMLLREVLKIDTSAYNQSTLNTPPVVAAAALAVVEKVESESSLLDDKDKFDAFKKLIEGGDDEDCAPVKRPADDEQRYAKKAKVTSDEEEEEGIKIQPSLV